MKGLLTSGFRIPPLGTSQYFSRKVILDVNAAGCRFSLVGFEDSFEGLDNTFDKQYNYMITLRNVYALGDTRSEGECLEDVSRYAPFLERLLSEGWVAESRIYIREGKVYLKHEDASLSLHPVSVVSYEAERPYSSSSTERREEGFGLLKDPFA